VRSWILSLVLAAAACAQPYQPTADELGRIRSRLDDLTTRLERLGTRPDAALLADVEIYRKAGEWILRYPEEFFTKAYVANALKVLDHGIARAQELERGDAAWPAQKGRIVRGYRSALDGSVQPYALIIPESYDGRRSVRLDLVLHGRGATLNEVSFIAAHESATAVPATQDFIQMEVYGRGNNAYRWAGEADVFEALASVEKRYRIDPARIVLRGFSMGGAGTWHIGLHYPSRWVAMEAGAGFTETHRYAKLKDTPAWQEPTLHIYDAVDYSLNAEDLAVVGYGGEIDPQLQASTNIREQLGREGFHFNHEGLNWFGTDLRAIFLVGPQTPHRFHPESKKTSDEFLNRAVAKGRVDRPEQIHFVTYTQRYGNCFWLNVDGLARQYERAEVEAKQKGGETVIKTTNVSHLLLDAAGNVTVDGKSFRAGALRLEKVRGAWAAEPRKSKSALRKQHGLQGPIDDAFLEPFLCVRPTGTPLSPAATRYATRALDDFAQDYAKYFRADVRIKDDKAISSADMANSNLILFGDPGSNAVIAKVLAKLPLEWTAETVKLGSRQANAAESVPVMIYPNPLNPAKYVVINSGHTFHTADLKGTNALLYPRLGDWAIVQAADGATVTAGFFDEAWQLR
jgi:pimeloyl-ACP methyl ester carboxylesterase